MIFAFVLTILLVIVPIVVYSIYSDNKRKLAKLNGGLNADDIAALRAELDQVKERLAMLDHVNERLAVLEEIVTDDRYQLDRELKQIESA